jgi:hypothetical protein
VRGDGVAEDEAVTKRKARRKRALARMRAERAVRAKAIWDAASWQKVDNSLELNVGDIVDGGVVLKLWHPTSTALIGKL